MPTTTHREVSVAPDKFEVVADDAAGQTIVLGGPLPLPYSLPE